MISDLEKVVIEKYQQVGMQKGSEFLVPSQLAISFVEDLRDVGLYILGLTTWKYVRIPDDGSYGIMEELAYEYDVDESIKNIDESAQHIIEHIKKIQDKVDMITIYPDLLEEK